MAKKINRIECDWTCFGRWDTFIIILLGMSNIVQNCILLIFLR